MNRSNMASIAKARPGIAIADNALVFREADEIFCSILQCDRSGLLGQKVSAVLPEFKNLSAHKGSHAHFLAHRSSGQILVIDCVIVPEGGLLRYILFCQDLTWCGQVMKQCDNLNQQNQLQLQMLSKLSDGVFLCDASGVPLFSNEAFRTLSGLEFGMFMKDTVQSSLERGLIPNSCVLQVLEQGEPVSAVINYPRGRTCLVSGSPIFLDGKLSHAVAIVRDLTMLNSLQEQLESEKSLRHAYKRKLDEIESKLPGSAQFITTSRIMQNVYDKLVRISNIMCPVLIRGETGVGKDFAAEFLHKTCPHTKGGRLIKVNCGAIPENLMESELFGYEGGAFTGASKGGKAGLFELAQDGTLFLDEIGDMPLHLQVKLLNSIQEQKFFRVGGTRLISFNARIISATNADLDKLIAQGRFRLDLYYRLNVTILQIPPLRERRDDILPLALRFLEEFNRKYGKSTQFSPRTIELLIKYSWPGNIRELRNVIERVVVMSGSDVLEPHTFEGSILDSSGGATLREFIEEDHLSLREKVAQYEASCIRQSMAAHGDMQAVADALGIDLSTLMRKKKKYRISRVPPGSN